VPPADAGALAVALRRLLSASPGGATDLAATELAARLGHNGRRRVLERFTWARCATGVVEQYRQVLSEHEHEHGHGHGHGHGHVAGDARARARRG
jgi:glycosyltransferase involved in cell wall biosynthesis